MNRWSRLRILLGACIIGTIGILAQSNILIAASVILLVFSGVRYKQTPATNYTEKFGPPDPDATPTAGFGAMLQENGLDSEGEKKEGEE